MNKMNVTSLLNTGAAAVGRLANAQAGAPLEDTPMNMYHQDQNTSQTTGDQLRLPVRSSRTPWNADGYSLPNLTHNLKDNNLQQQHRPFDSDSTPTAYSDAAAADPMTSPKSSPKHHKFSDSRGSMSSTYSTTNMSLSSAASCHSRISSLSTVSEYQPLSLNGGGIYGSSDCGTERRLSASCPTVVEPPRGENDEEDGNEGGGEDEGMGSEDCGRSPSDAVMMRNRLSGSARYVDAFFYFAIIFQVLCVALCALLCLFVLVATPAFCLVYLWVPLCCCLNAPFLAVEIVSPKNVLGGGDWRSLAEMKGVGVSHGFMRLKVSSSLPVIWKNVLARFWKCLLLPSPFMAQAPYCTLQDCPFFHPMNCY